MSKGEDKIEDATADAVREELGADNILEVDGEWIARWLTEFLCRARLRDVADQYGAVMGRPRLGSITEMRHGLIGELVASTWDEESWRRMHATLDKSDDPPLLSPVVREKIRRIGELLDHLPRQRR